ncbi:hypothetical protein GALMADRAFT_259201 [Galerina marginata CBS 339.88]|uniref:Uncharacterized protein n=1 Tax=Galerina marginata (strain CBS 339.88) TaxID=685588 RepID=A0A067S6P1_GALM3|nr:hypothetical protein GALMADRAFT_259201 [Galerina marginata CBS 339.88]
MQPSSISSEEFESVDFEEPHTNSMPPPSPLRPSHSLSPSLSVDDDALTMPDSSASKIKGNESEPPLEVIDSFLPILQFLPGLTLIDGVYYHHGTVSQADIEKLCAYTRRIGEFTLTDNIKESKYPVHLGTLLRVVQLHNCIALGPLFPSLCRLRIVDAQLSFDYLNLFLTPSLRSLEVVNIPEARKTVLSVFLDAVAQESPNLTQLTLGPGRLPGHLLRTFSTFNHLVQLELIELLPSFDSALLERIGSLPALEVFVLHAADSLYGSNPSEPTPNAMQDEPPSLSPWSPRPDPWSSISDPIPADTIRSPGYRTPSPIPSTRSPSPIADPIPDTPGPSDGPALFIALVDSFPITELPDVPVVRHFTVLKKLHVIGCLALIEDLIGLVASEDIMDLALTLVWSPPKPKRKNAASVVQLNVIESFATAVELAHQKWFETLKGVLIGRKEDGLSPNITTPAFPAAMFEVLLLHHTLKCLEVTGWTLNSSSSNTLQLLAAKAPLKLESLHLPIDDTSPRFSLTSLRTIAKACPQLVSLRCNIKHLSNVPEYPSRMPATNVLAHGLEVLSVGNSSPHPDPQRLLRVARHLRVLFPNLKKIETHEGHNDEQWKYIGNLVELCQNAYLDATEHEKAAYAK